MSAAQPRGCPATPTWRPSCWRRGASRRPAAACAMLTARPEASGIRCWPSSRPSAIRRWARPRDPTFAGIGCTASFPCWTTIDGCGWGAPSTDWGMTRPPSCCTRICCSAPEVRRSPTRRASTWPTWSATRASTNAPSSCTRTMPRRTPPAGPRSSTAWPSCTPPPVMSKGHCGHGCA